MELEHVFREHAMCHVLKLKLLVVKYELKTAIAEDIIQVSLFYIFFHILLQILFHKLF